MPKFEVWMPEDSRELSALYEGADAQDVARQYLRDSEQTFVEGASGQVNVALDSDDDVKIVTFNVERVLDIVTTLEGAEFSGVAEKDDDDGTETNRT